MIPSVLAWQLKNGTADFIRSTFPINNRYFKDAIEQFVGSDESLFHEPYFTIKMPFRQSIDDMEYFESIELPFVPHLHQAKAFDRLCSDNPKSTIVATGTGSGKTECFLYPVLDHCYKCREEKGIKALFIYPMNALASDQAIRIAREIYKNDKLKDNVTVGMYVGGEDENHFTTMGEDHVITDHKSMLEAPPSILITNYKMLDYLLVRPKDTKLWSVNTPFTLKYIVVDELHTFDGAQGTDLACLIRRLKARLNIPNNHLCCIGTSATIGNGDDRDSILKYASDVFDTEFDVDAIITEDRISTDEFLSGSDVEYDRIPLNSEIDKIYESIEKDSESDFLKKSMKYWAEVDSDDPYSEEVRIDLSERLKSHLFFRDLLKCTEKGNFQISDIVNDMASRHDSLSHVQNVDILFVSAIALISHARTRSKRIDPFLQVHVEVWFKELKRIVSKISVGSTKLASADELIIDEKSQYLPIVCCRGCGCAGWLTRLNDRRNLEVKDLDLLYDSYFSGSNTILMAFPSDDDNRYPDMDSGWICPHCMTAQNGSTGSDTCPDCGERMVHVHFPRKYAKHGRLFDCPVCHSPRGMSLFGFRAPSETSVLISQMFASKFNNDKKIIAFTDNVQDASHHASFYNYRVNRFLLRSTIQHFVDEYGNGMSLDTFGDSLVDHLRSVMSDEEYVSNHVPPNLIWARAYEKMLVEGHIEDSHDRDVLMGWISNRLKHDILLEYGVESTQGRTLQTSSASSLAFNPDDIMRVAQSILQMRNMLPDLSRLSEHDLQRMVYFVLDTMRSRGAFADHYLKKCAYEGSTYLEHDIWAPGPRPGRNTPHFLCNTTDELHGDSKSLFDNLVSPIFTRVLKKYLPENSNSITVTTILKVIADEAVNERILEVIPNKKGLLAWAICMDRLFVTNDVQPMVCSSCGVHHNVASSNVKFLEGSKCTTIGCNGTLRIIDQVEKYYYDFYKNGDLSRVHAEEHTGLLARKKREDVEKSFKSSGLDRKPWDVNILSATPTLEMGIDVGDLSTTIMTSVPPTQSKYFQRAGRAGRTDGNSVNVVIARNKPYDCYYYAEPREMIAGSLDCPRVFLSASAVLERQYIAYCMDTWIKEDPKGASIPNSLNGVLPTLNNPDYSKFPHNYLKYVKENSDRLFDNFINLFGNELSDDTIDELRTFVFGNEDSKYPLDSMVLDSFIEARNQKTAILDNVKKCEELIEEIKKRPADSSFEEQIKDLEDERDAYLRVVQEIVSKNIFNFMSDEGLLPNYAFPESGVILKSVLIKDPKENAPRGTPHDKAYYEYQRSAVSAITEFAPDNKFYADGHVLKIDRIDMPTSKLEKWRLCPCCSHMELNSHSMHTTSCPCCGSVGWGDVKQTQDMLRAKMVYSIGSYRKSVVTDANEEREFKSYLRQTLVDVDEDKDVGDAYGIETDKFSFGYEYVRKATIREINFGIRSEQGASIAVAGMEAKRSGFKICKHCGKIQTDKGPKHTPNCKYRSSAKEEDYEICTFLYRELNTEAIRILIPTVASEPSDFRVSSFVAAFMLGMKEHFGNVDHLLATVSSVPIEQGFNKMYLVIYDSVPGGTGYLKQLMCESDSMMDVLSKALTRLNNCKCANDPEKDGCYHCLLTYRQSRDSSISRSMAIDMLDSILRNRKSVKKVDKVGSIEVNSLFDSELEARFISLLESYCEVNKDSCSFGRVSIHEKKGYVLRIFGNEWTIEPQKDLDESHGIVVACRPDFMFWPQRGSKSKPVAVFTDGFGFHKDRVADDTLKRDSLIHSGKFRVWSLSWKDVTERSSDHSTHALSYDDMTTPGLYTAMVSQEKADSVDPAHMGPFDLLMEYLGNIDAEHDFIARAKAYSMALLNPTSVQHPPADIIDSCRQINQEISLRPFCDSPTIFGKFDPTGYKGLMIYSYVGFDDFKEKGLGSKITVYSLLDDSEGSLEEYKEYERRWNGMLSFMNVMQFLDSDFTSVSSTGIKMSSYTPLMIVNKVDDL